MNIYCVLLKYINIPLRATKEIHYWISFFVYSYYLIHLILHYDILKSEKTKTFTIQ